MRPHELDGARCAQPEATGQPQHPAAPRAAGAGAARRRTRGHTSPDWEQPCRAGGAQLRQAGAVGCVRVAGSIALSRRSGNATKLLPFFDNDWAFQLVLYLLDEMLGRCCSAEQLPCTTTPRPLRRRPPGTRRPDEPACFLYFLFIATVLLQAALHREPSPLSPPCPGASGFPGAEETSQKIKYDYGNYDDYLHTGAHARPTLKSY